MVSPPNDNVLIVPSRNVLLTGSAWRGGFRNISHDATGPRPAGRIEEGKEGSNHTAASSGRDRPDRAACSPAVEAVESQRRQGRRPCATRPAIQSQAGRKGRANCAGDIEPRGLCGLRPDTGGRISGRKTRHSCGARNRTAVDDRRQTVARPAPGRGEDPPMEAAAVSRRRTGPVGYQRARLAGRAGAEVVPDRHDRRRLQPRLRAVRAARFDRREHAFAVELRGAVRPAGELLHGQGELVSNCSEGRARQQATAPRRTGALASDADRTGAARTGHCLDRGAFAAGQRARGAQFSNGAGPVGEGVACGRGEDAGAGQRLSGSQVHPVVEPDDSRRAGQQRRCSPAFRQGTLAGGFAELCGETRKVSNDYTIQFDNQIWQIARSEIGAGLRGGVVRVEFRLDESLAVRFGKRYVAVTQCQPRPKVPRPKVYPNRKPAAPRAKSQWMKNFRLTSPEKTALDAIAPPAIRSAKLIR